jgi:hypothetical protein
MTSKPRIYADFNKLDEKRRAILTCYDTARDLAALGMSFYEGMEATLYMTDDVDESGAPDCLEVDATIEFDGVHKHWVGTFNWDDLEYRSKKMKKQ